MRKIKKGDKFRHNADDVEVLDRRENLILATVSGNAGTYYDISTPFVDNSGDEHFSPSPNANGLIETIAGGQKTPRTLAEQVIRFNERCEAIEMDRRNKAAALETIEKRTATRAARIIEVRNARDDARSELAALVNSDVPITTAIQTKKAAALATEITKCEQILTIIR